MIRRIPIAMMLAYCGFCLAQPPAWIASAPLNTWVEASDNTPDAVVAPMLATTNPLYPVAAYSGSGAYNALTGYTGAAPWCEDMGPCGEMFYPPAGGHENNFACTKAFTFGYSPVTRLFRVRTAVQYPGDIAPGWWNWNWLPGEDSNHDGVVDARDQPPELRNYGEVSAATKLPWAGHTRWNTVYQPAAQAGNTSGRVILSLVADAHGSGNLKSFQAHACDLDNDIWSRTGDTHEWTLYSSVSGTDTTWGWAVPAPYSTADAKTFSCHNAVYDPVRNQVWRFGYGASAFSDRLSLASPDSQWQHVPNNGTPYFMQKQPLYLPGLDYVALLAASWSSTTTLNDIAIFPASSSGRVTWRQIAATGADFTYDAGEAVSACFAPWLGPRGSIVAVNWGGGFTTGGSAYDLWALPLPASVDSPWVWQKLERTPASPQIDNTRSWPYQKLFAANKLKTIFLCPLWGTERMWAFRVENLGTTAGEKNAPANTLCRVRGAASFRFYNMKGQLVRTIKGDWNMMDRLANFEKGLSNGLYVCRISGGEDRRTVKRLIMK